MRFDACERAFRRREPYHMTSAAAAASQKVEQSYGMEHLFDNEALTDRRPFSLLKLLNKGHWRKIAISIVRM